MNFRQLANLDPLGWTELLAQVPETEGALVTGVDADPLPDRSHLIRYWLTLAGHSDPVTFVGKRTNAIEALFFRHLAPELPALVPPCWFGDALGDQGWIVLADVPQDRPVEHWDDSDLDAAVAGLALLHATFWEQPDYLAKFDWLPHYRDWDPAVLRERYERQLSRRVSDHALRRAGRFAPALLDGAAALRQLERLGEWPDVFDRRHIRAAADLLDDPVPMLQPLFELPVGLVHGAPSPDHWHRSLFGGTRLFDWRHCYVGLPLMDLIYFLEAYHQHRALERPWANYAVQNLFEETAIDSYFLEMSVQEAVAFPARRQRQALPAARCLTILTAYFPLFAEWLARFPDDFDSWHSLRQLDRPALQRAGYHQLARIRTHLRGALNRFLQAYQIL